MGLKGVCLSRKTWHFIWFCLSNSISTPSILKEISPEYSLEGLMLKLKLQFFGHLMERADSLQQTLMLGKIESRRRRGRQRMRWMGGITDFMHESLSTLHDLGMDRVALRAAVHGITKSRTWLSDWTELNWLSQQNYNDVEQISGCQILGEGSKEGLVKG